MAVVVVAKAVVYLLCLWNVVVAVGLLGLVIFCSNQLGCNFETKVSKS